MEHLVSHYNVVGGDEEVIKAAKLVQQWLREMSDSLRQVANSEPEGMKYD